MKSSIILISLLFPFLTFAAEEVKEAPPKPTLKASAELGALFQTGDTESGDLKAGFDVDYEFGRWVALLRTDLLVKKIEEEDVNGKKSYETSDQKWSVAGQANYKLQEKGKNYIYTSLYFEDDRFSSFDNQSSISAGWGRKWYETPVSSLYADIGPGFKRDRVKATDTQDADTRTTFIGQAQLLYKRKLNEHVDFKQYLVAKYAFDTDENSVYTAETSISTKLIETLQLKFSYKIDHDTEVDAGKENTNTETAITIVYSF